LVGGPLVLGGMCFVIVLTRRSRRQPRSGLPDPEGRKHQLRSSSGRLVGLGKVGWFVFGFGAGRGVELGLACRAGLVGV
jgi:hypothetical protein